MDLSYDEIRRIQRLEKNSSKLAEIDNDFYSDLKSFIAQEKKLYLESLKDFSSTKSRDFTNLRRMAEEVFAMREKKILNLALVASRTGETADSNLTHEEKKLFNGLLGLLRSHGRLFERVFTAESGAGESRKDLNNMLVEILSDIPGFVGSDMKEYGPFGKGDEVLLPRKIALLLSEKKLAEVKP